MQVGHSWYDYECDPGRFEIKDLAAAADGTVQRLWVVVQSRCGSDSDGLFGEIRINEPGTPAIFALRGSRAFWRATSAATRPATRCR